MACELTRLIKGMVLAATENRPGKERTNDSNDDGIDKANRLIEAALHAFVDDWDGGEIKRLIMAARIAYHKNEPPRSAPMKERLVYLDANELYIKARVWTGVL